MIFLNFSKDEHPSGDYKNLAKAAGVDGLAPCHPPTKIPGAESRPKVNPIKRIEGPCSRKKNRSDKDEGAVRTVIPPWKSEYADGIGKTGNTIIKEKLHQHGVLSRGKNSSSKNGCGT